MDFTLCASANVLLIFKEAGQPAEHNVKGTILRLRNRNGQETAERDDVHDYTTFDFASNDLNASCIYKFTLEEDTFIQLCVLGNIIQPRKGGGLEGVAQHMEDFCRVKHENVDSPIGSIRRFKVNNFCFLDVRLLEMERIPPVHTDTPGPVSYVIEVRSYTYMQSVEY